MIPARPFGTPSMRAEAEIGIISLLEHLGYNPEDPGIKDTPSRVVKAFEEMTAGKLQDPKDILTTVFDEKTDEMVVLRNISFVSLCEHHLLPFMGTATVAYLPKDKVVGLSKLARLVECFARRLQIQERMTTEIATSLQEHLDCLGVGVQIVAGHSCMSCRGVRQSGSEMITSALLGAFRENPLTRAEFLSIANGHL